MIFSLLSKLLIRIRVHQSLHLVLLCDLDLGQPAVSLWTLVDSRGLLLKRTVGLDDGAGNWCHDIGGGLHGFDSSDRFAGGNFQVGGGKLDENDIADCLSSVG